MDRAKTDLWDRLSKTKKSILLYGMGNGAEKLLSVLQKRNIPVSGIFSSEGFGRGKCFCGIPVESLEALTGRYGKENLLILVAFGSPLPELFSRMEELEREYELYLPDLPVFGDVLFDKAFYNEHLTEMEKARELFCDERSKDLFDALVAYKLSGELSYLKEATSDPCDDLLELVLTDELSQACVVGAYDGDTAKVLCDLKKSKAPLTLYAVEPDPKNFSKLETYAKSETRAKIVPIRACAWDRREELAFDGSHNRNASVLSARSSVLFGRPPKVLPVQAERLDDLLGEARLDYIKYDVEGAEKEAITGSERLIKRSFPTLAVSLYHRSEDLFFLPLFLKEKFPEYDSFYLRRKKGFPAWDITLYAKKSKTD